MASDEYTTNTSRTKQIHFADAGRKKLLITDDVKELLSVRTNGVDITDITLGNSVTAIQDNCFRGFQNLRSVNGGSNCKYIGENAFRDCTNLSSCDMVGNAGTTMSFIGQRAFANTNLKRVRLDLQSTTYSGGVQNEAFASCYNLTSVEMVRSSLIPPNGFRDCSSLVEASFPNQTSYVYDGCFINNKSLESFRFPSKIQSIGGEMFKGCSKLTSVVVDDADDYPSTMRTVGPGVFSGCDNLTSFTLPRSISSLSQIDQVFLSGSNVQYLRLNGMDDNILSAAQETTQLSIGFDKRGYVTGADYIYAAYLDAIERGIPMVVITNYSTSMDRQQDSPQCRSLNYFLNTREWTNFMRKYENVCYFVYAGWIEDSDLFMDVSFGHNPEAEKKYGMKFSKYPMWFGGSYEPLVNEPASQTESVDAELYAKICLFWRKSGFEEPIRKNINVMGTTEPADPSKDVYNPGPRYYIEPVIKDATTPVSSGSAYKTVTMTKFGSPLSSIQIISKSNTFYTVTEDSKPDAYIPPEPDNTSFDGFQPGIWYGRASKLKEYVDDKNLPCFIAFSDVGSPAGKEFRTYIYNNPDFQKWVVDSGYYFCFVETQSYAEYSDVTTNAYFVYNTWAKRTSMQIPVFIYYWNKPDGSIIWNLSSYQDTQMTYRELESSIEDNFNDYPQSNL